MIGLKKKKKQMEEITEKETTSDGKIKLTKEMPEIEKELPISVPQARLIRNKGQIMDFEVEYTPDKASYWYGGKYLFSFHFPDNYPFNPPKVMCKTKIYHPNIDYDGNVCLICLKMIGILLILEQVVLQEFIIYLLSLILMTLLIMKLLSL